MNLMRDVKDYKSAIQKMRRLSSGIDKTFKDTFDEMTSWMDSQQDKFKTDTMKYRKIVVAGDDITFVCNARLAIPAVKYFLEKLNEKKTDFIQTEEDKNQFLPHVQVSPSLIHTSHSQMHIWWLKHVVTVQRKGQRVRSVQ